MANTLSTEKQAMVIGALAEGSSIRSIERMTGVHRDTIMRLGVKVGQGCTALMDAKLGNLTCTNLQLDEIWGFIGKKERHCRPTDNPELGDAWTFCAIDSDSKLVPSFKVGKRDRETANAFADDLASRLTVRVQLSTDALRAYVEAVEGAFGSEVDYAQVIKEYGKDDDHVTPERKYSPSVVLSVEKKRIMGNPDLELASTSYVERLNGTTRLHMRRLTRLTYAFNKKLDNFKAAVGLHFAYYNFCLRHASLRCTPAMEAGIERDFWTVRDLVEATA
jgi:IS1 family transposase